MKLLKRHSVGAFAVLALFLITGCGENALETEAKYPTGGHRDTASGNDIYAERESIFGSDGLGILGGRSDNNNSTGNNGIDVNSFLWRASLDTVSFMPLASADPFGGVILTDWHTPGEAAEERFKLNVFILGRELRSDGVRVRVFKQMRKGNDWVDTNAAPETARQLEDAILTRARQLRVAHLADK